MTIATPCYLRVKRKILTHTFSKNSKFFCSQTLIIFRDRSIPTDSSILAINEVSIC